MEQSKIRVGMSTLIQMNLEIEANKKRVEALESKQGGEKTKLGEPEKVKVTKKKG